MPDREAEIVAFGLLLPGAVMMEKCRTVVPWNYLGHVLVYSEENEIDVLSVFKGWLLEGL